MLQVNACYWQAHHSTEMELKLAQVGGVTESYHTCIVWTWTQLRENHFALLAQEEFYAPETSTGQSLGHFGCNMLCFLQCFLWQLEWLPALAVVATFLDVSDRRAEEGRTILLGYGEECELRVEIYEFLDDDFLHIATTFLHSFLVSLHEFVVIVYIALSMSAGTHQWLHYTWETDFVGCILEFLECLSVEILGCAQTQFLGSQIADGTAVHGVVHGTGRRYNLNALFLEVEETLCTDSFNLRHDDVWVMFLNHCGQCVAIEH